MKILRLKPDAQEMAFRTIKKFKSVELEKSSTERFLADEQNYLLVALEQELPIGFLVAYELNRIGDNSSMILLYEIEVNKNNRRKGVGKALINHLKDLAKKKGYKKIFVPTHESNIPAMSLYQKTGGIRTANDDVIFTYRTNE